MQSFKRLELQALSLDRLHSTMLPQGRTEMDNGSALLDSGLPRVNREGCKALPSLAVELGRQQ